MSNGNGFSNRINQSQADTRKMLAEWRSNNFQEVELPLSGRRLQVRDIGVIDLVVEGKIPNTMMDLVQQLTENKISEAEMMKEHSAEFGALIDLVFMHSVVYPPVAEEPDDEHISPKDFVYGDKMALFSWVNREAQIVRPFRPANGKSVALALDE
jgi:hypothetical protein